MPLPVFIVELPYRIGKNGLLLGKTCKCSPKCIFVNIVKGIQLVLDRTNTTGAVCKCLFAKYCNTR
jgi:hypothetical protein